MRIKSKSKDIMTSNHVIIDNEFENNLKQLNDKKIEYLKEFESVNIDSNNKIVNVCVLDSSNANSRENWYNSMSEKIINGTNDELFIVITMGKIAKNYKPLQFTKNNIDKLYHVLKFTPLDSYCDKKYRNIRTFTDILNHVTINITTEDNVVFKMF